MKQTGFTLIEMIVVLLIIGLLTSMTTVRLLRQVAPLEAELTSIGRLAVSSGEAATGGEDATGLRPTVRCLPDGRATGEGVDPIRGCR